MKAEDIKVGMWLRWDGCGVYRAIGNGGHDGMVVVEGLNDPGVHTEATASGFEPWTPRVGEWVRRKSDGTAFEVKYIPTFTEWLANVEPCLPPAPTTTYLRRADGVEVPAVVGVDFGFEVKTEAHHWTASAPLVAITEADAIDYLDQADAADRRYRAHVAGANSTCPKCGGLAYLGLQEARCLAPKCERVEPEPTRVVEMWRDADGEVSPVRFTAAERVWEAVGRSVNAQHPIREEAIRLWREEVSRG